MKWQRWHAFAAFAAAVLVAIGFISFGKCGEAPANTDAGASLEPPARAPDDLVADLYVSSPSSSWSKLQRGVGGAMGILPTTLPGVIVALMDLDASLGTELDGTAPMFGVVAGNPADPGAAVAIRLVDSRRARGLLADGETSRFTTKDVSGMTLLVPKRQDPRQEGKLAIALTPNGYLLIARREADVGRLGPYVTRTLPARFAAAPPATAAAVVEIPRSAIHTVIGPKLESLWKDGKSFLLAEDVRMRAERGRSADFGDPTAIVAALDGLLGRRLAVASDLEKVRVVIDVTDDAVAIDATLTPVAGANGPARKWVDGMKVGDLAPVLALSSTSALALSTRDGEAERDEQSKELEKAISTSLGSRLKDPSKLHDVFEATTKARGEAVALALALDDPSGIFVRAPVRDAASADKAIRGALDLAKTEPFKELLRARDVVSTNEELSGLGKISVVTLTRDETPRSGKRARAGDAGAALSAKKTNPSVGAAWMVDQGTLLLGTGAEALVTLKLGGRPDRKLAGEPSLERFTSSVGGDATTVIIGQPLRLDPKRANLPMAPLGMAIGRKGSDAFVRIDIADALVREAARWQMGF